MSDPSGSVVAVCLGPGGIPKRAVDEAVLGELGLEGDGHRQSFHGGERRALCLLSVEEVRSLAADGVPIGAEGTFGENVLTEGIDLTALRPGQRLAIGDEVLVELDDIREPCGTLKKLDARFPDLMVGRSGWMCRVLRGGVLRAGLRIRLAAAD